MGLMDAEAELDSADPVDWQNAKLQALVVYSAPADLGMNRSVPAAGALLQISCAHTEKSQVVGAALPGSLPDLECDGGRSPTLLLAGDADTNVPHRHAMALQAALQKVHVPSRLLIIPRGTHGPTFGLAVDAPRPTDWPDYNSEMVRWFDEHLKTTKPAH